MHVYRRFTRSRWWVLALVAVGILGIAECYVRGILWARPGSAPVEFRDLPGEIGIRLEGPSNQWQISFRQGEISHTNHLPHAGETAIAGGGEVGPPWLPDRFRIPGSGPYMLGPDEKYLVAGAESVESHYYQTPRLLVVDMAADELIVQIDSGGNWGVASVAWSHDGRYFAVLKRVGDWGVCHVEIIGFLLGYPVQLYTFYLTIMDLKGTVVAETLLLYRAPFVAGEVVWLR